MKRNFQPSWQVSWLMLGLLTAPLALAEPFLGLETLTPEELANYSFDIEEDTPLVSDLSIGQRYVLDKYRRDLKDLIARRLGILSLKGDKRDLPTLQAVIDKELIRSDEVREWQTLGVMFGDILVEEMGLHWVSYEDDLGVSKALRWQQSENYVFPVTMFSKRVQFRETINIQALYDKLNTDVQQFREYEKAHPSFQTP